MELPNKIFAILLVIFLPTVLVWALLIREEKRSNVMVIAKAIWLMLFMFVDLFKDILVIFALFA